MFLFENILYSVFQRAKQINLKKESWTQPMFTLWLQIDI